MFASIEDVERIRRAELRSGRAPLVARLSPRPAKPAASLPELACEIDFAADALEVPAERFPRTVFRTRDF